MEDDVLRKVFLEKIDILLIRSTVALGVQLPNG